MDASPLIRTGGDRLVTFLRLVLGAVILPHGLQKTLGWFGGYGFDGTMGYFTGQLHIPTLFGVLTILAESLGGIGLLTGTLTRVAAFGVFSVMLVATLLVHWPVGFFMNWDGRQAGEGFEYHLLAMAIAITVMVRGGGAWSVDRALSRSRPGGAEAGAGSR